MKSCTLIKNPEWNTLRQKSTIFLNDTNKPLSQSLQRRLYKYGLGVIQDLDLEFILNWDCEITRIIERDDDLLADSSYIISWTNNKAIISINGIYLDSKNTPYLHHGLSIDQA